jgi:PAS domain S-box-containing protein
MEDRESQGGGDSTPRRRVKLDLRTGEGLFHELVESAPDAMVIVDGDGVISLVNERAEGLFGYPRGELIGQHIELLLPEVLRQRHVMHRRRYMASPRARPMGEGMDLLATRRDGTEFVADISLSPLWTDRGLLISAAVRDISQQLLRQLEQALVPRMKISSRWELAWRYRPAVRAMLLGGDFIGVCERSDGSLAMLIGDVVGHGPVSAGTGAMLRAAWLGAVQGDLPIEAIPRLLHRLLTNQADRSATTMATACLAEVDRQARELRMIRAGHDAPLMITPDGTVVIDNEHGPTLGLGQADHWPVRQLALPRDAAIMFFTDGLTERRATPESARQFDSLVPLIDTQAVLTQAPDQAIDELLRRAFPQGTDHLEDDVAVILLNLGRSAVRDDGDEQALANVA